jgi:hypothetical protein
MRFDSNPPPSAGNSMPAANRRRAGIPPWIMPFLRFRFARRRNRPFRPHVGCKANSASP